MKPYWKLFRRLPKVELPKTNGPGPKLIFETKASIGPLTFRMYGFEDECDEDSEADCDSEADFDGEEDYCEDRMEEPVDDEADVEDQPIVASVYKSTLFLETKALPRPLIYDK